MPRHSSSERSTNARRPPPPIPALAKHASTRPNSASVAANAASTDLRSVTSQIRASTALPWARSCVEARSFFCELRPQIETAQPDRASASAMPSPMPPLPPVITATRPERSKSLTLLAPRCSGAIEHTGTPRRKFAAGSVRLPGRGLRRANVREEPVDLSIDRIGVAEQILRAGAHGLGGLVGIVGGFGELRQLFRNLLNAVAGRAGAAGDLAGRRGLLVNRGRHRARQAFDVADR